MAMERQPELTPAELKALLRWQNTAHYHTIQAHLRRGDGPPEVEAMAEAIDAAIRRSVLPAGLPLHRGVRSSLHTFRLDRRDLGALLGAEPLRLAGFLATSLSERVALGHTGDEPGPGGQVLMRLVTGTACRGLRLDDLPTHNRWITDQEVLVGPRRPLEITNVDVRPHLTVVEGVIH